MYIYIVQQRMARRSHFWPSKKSAPNVRHSRAQSAEASAPKASGIICAMAIHGRLSNQRAAQSFALLWVSVCC